MERAERKELIRTVYLYLFSLVGLVLVVIGCVRFVDLGLKVWIFKKADQVVIYPDYPRKIVAPGELAQELSPEEEKKYKEEQLEFKTKEKEAQRERTAANSLAMIIVGVPLFLYHWRTIQRSKEQR